MNYIAAHLGGWDALLLRGEPPHILGVRNKDDAEIRKPKE